MSELAQIAQDEKCDPLELERIYALLPTGDNGDFTYLEMANRAILEISSLVDRTNDGLARAQRMAKKLRLMSKLLAVKAQHLFSGLVD